MLSTSGHIAALVNPPGNPKASYRTGPVGPGGPEDPEQWLVQNATELAPVIEKFLSEPGEQP